MAAVVDASPNEIDLRTELDGEHAADAAGRVGRRRPHLTGRELTVVAATLVLLCGYNPSLRASFTVVRLPALGLLIVLGAAPLARAVRRRDPAALAATALLAWAAISTAASSRPLIALIGTVDWMTGWLFLAGCVAAWAVGRELSEPGRRMLWATLIAGITVNAALAWLQAFFTLGVPTLDPGARSLGLVGNAAQLATLLAGALVAAFVHPPRRHRVAWLVWAVVMGGALQAAGARLALTVTVAGAALSVVVGLIRRRALGPVLALAAAGGVLLVTLAPQASATGRVVSDGTSDAAGRASVWERGIDAANARPVLGWGPARFAEGAVRTGGAAVLGSQLFTDVHSLPIQLAATIGYPGAVAAGAWLVLAGRRARGRAALACLAPVPLLFVQPLSIATAPLLALTLGLAAPAPNELAAAPGQVRRPRGPARVVFAIAIGIVVAESARLVGGAWMWRSGALANDEARLARAEQLLPGWSDLAIARAEAHTWQALSSADAGERDRQRAAAVAAAREAVRREPTDISALTMLASLELRWGDVGRAVTVAESLLKALPESLAARAVLADAAAQTGDQAGRMRWCAEVAERKANYRVDSCVNAG